MPFRELQLELYDLDDRIRQTVKKIKRPASEPPSVNGSFKGLFQPLHEVKAAEYMTG